MIDAEVMFALMRVWKPVLMCPYVAGLAGFRFSQFFLAHK